MRVLHFLDSVNRGGTEVLALDICRNASQIGFDLTMVTSKGGILESEFKNSQTNFYRFQRNYPIDFKLIRKLRKLIKDNKIEIVHSHQAVEGLHLFLATIGLKNVKQVMSFHGLIADKKNHYTMKFLLPRMDANIVCSRGLLNWLTKIYRAESIKNVSVVYNGTDAERLKPSKKSIKIELGLSENTRLIGMIANFYREDRKDQWTVCKALPEIFEKISDVHCVFVGKVEEGAEHKFEKCFEFCQQNGIGEKVHFLNVRNDIPDILASLNVFILSSIHEGMPIALIEAMLAGVSAVISDIEPFMEITADGKYANIFPVGDNKELAGKVINLLTNENANKTLAESAQQFAGENYSIEVHLRKLKMLYEGIL